MTRRKGGRKGLTKESTNVPRKAVDVEPGDVHMRPGSVFIRNLSLV